MDEELKRLSESRLYLAMLASAGDELSEKEVAALTKIVDTVAAQIAPILAEIDQTFRQYTLHDISHSVNIIDLMGRMLPDEVLEGLNGLEICFALLAALLHDSGMHMEESEKSDVLESSLFADFCTSNSSRTDEAARARTGEDVERAEAIEAALLAEYVRRTHAARSSAYVRKTFGDLLVFREESFADRVADLCESHAWAVLVDQASDRSRCVEALQTSMEYPIGSVPVNVRFIGCLLRLADVMDFDRSRTPVSVFTSLHFTEGRSWEEWNKHLQVGGWTVQPTRVRFRVECEHPAFYVAVLEFLDSVDKELRDVQYLIERFDRSVPEHPYRLDLPQTCDKRGVTMKDPRFVAGGFRFSLDYEGIMNLLMDKSLYPEASLFLRELLQNGLDACRRLTAQHAASGSTQAYRPRITVWDHSSDLADRRVVFQDNGVGMSLGVLEEFFMRVGRSYYRSERFEGERRKLSEKGIELEASSQFGIGILSCFLVADNFEVETYQHGFDPLRVTVEGRTKYFIVERLARPETPQFPGENEDHLSETGDLTQPGTRVTVRLKDDVRIDVLSTLRQLAVNVDFEVEVRGTGGSSEAIDAFSWEKTSAARFCPSLSVGKRATEGLDLEALEENVSSVLVRSTVDFQRWDFSEHVRGSTWFWLLNATDMPRVTAGHLSVDQQLSPYGIAQWVHDVRIGWRDKDQNERERAMSLIDKGNTPGDQFLSRKWGRLETVSTTVREWNDLNDDVKSRVLFAALRPTSDDFPSWFDVAGFPELLLQGDPNWLDQDVRLGGLHSHPPDKIRLLASGFALHGIAIPGGVARWEPARAIMRAATLMPVQGTAWLDLRGGKAPSPAANRLFVDATSEGPKALVPYYRAIWRHVLEVLEQDATCLARRKWALRILQTAMHNAIASDPTLVAAEMELADVAIPYAVVESGNVVYRSKGDIVSLLGEVAPVVQKVGDSSAPDGLSWSDEMTRWLLELHVTGEGRPPTVVHLNRLRDDVHFFARS